jgi:hypothetical protein
MDSANRQEKTMNFLIPLSDTFALLGGSRRAYRTPLGECFDRTECLPEAIPVIKHRKEMQSFPPSVLFAALVMFLF